MCYVCGQDDDKLAKLRSENDLLHDLLKRQKEILDRELAVKVSWGLWMVDSCRRERGMGLAFMCPPC